MKIQLIDPRNKRLKNKIATYNSEDHTWTIGKSKKVYEAVFSYRYWVMKGEEENSEVSKYFNTIGTVKGGGRFPIKQLEDFKINGTESLYHSVRFFNKSLKGHTNGVVIDGFEVLEY